MTELTIDMPANMRSRDGSHPTDTINPEAGHPHPVHRVLVWVTAGIILIMGGILLADRLYQPEAFRFDRIVIGGSPQRIDSEALSQQLQTALGGNYFSVDMQKIEAVVSTFPWIEHVSVRRKWPDALLVTIDEHQPVARWGNTHWLTASGKAVALPSETQLALPVLAGPDKQSGEVWQTYQRWSQAFNRVGMKLISLELSAGHLWKGRVRPLASSSTEADLGFDIVLLESNADQQIDAFLNTFAGYLSERSSAISRVDLRYHHGFAVAWKAELEPTEPQK